jgi:hypothetical protein
MRLQLQCLTSSGAPHEHDTRSRGSQSRTAELWVPKTSSAGRIDAKRAGERLSLSKAPRWHQKAVWTERRTFGAGSLPTMSSDEYEQACHNGIIGMDRGKSLASSLEEDQSMG